jgi:DNA-binding transcriptional regulator GbsR (MarR family)
MQLSPVMERYILHWGEMGTRWGVNRSVAQIHALLYLAPQPLHADEISETLSIARSNVSTSLKELGALNLVKIHHVMGDRRDHFVAEKDVWRIFLAIVEARKLREIDPTLSVLRQCAIEAEDDRATDREAKARIADMLNFVESTTQWYEQMRAVPQPKLIGLMKLGARIARFVK